MRIVTPHDYHNVAIFLLTDAAAILCRVARVSVDPDLEPVRWDHLVAGLPDKTLHAAIAEIIKKGGDAVPRPYQEPDPVGDHSAPVLDPAAFQAFVAGYKAKEPVAAKRARLAAWLTAEHAAARDAALAHEASLKARDLAAQAQQLETDLTASLLAPVMPEDMTDPQPVAKRARVPRQRSGAPRTPRSAAQAARQPAQAKSPAPESPPTPAPVEARKGRAREERIYELAELPLDKLQAYFAELYGRPTKAAHKRTLAWRCVLAERARAAGEPVPHRGAVEPRSSLRLTREQVAQLLDLLPGADPQDHPVVGVLRAAAPAAQA